MFLSLTKNTKLINVSMDSNESFTAIHFLNNMIIKVVNASRKNEKRTEEIRIYHLLNNNLVKQ